MNTHALLLKVWFPRRTTHRLFYLSFSTVKTLWPPLLLSTDSKRRRLFRGQFLLLKTLLLVVSVGLSPPIVGATVKWCDPWWNRNSCFSQIADPSNRRRSLLNYTPDLSESDREFHFCPVTDAGGFSGYRGSVPASSAAVSYPAQSPGIRNHSMESFNPDLKNSQIPYG